MEHPLRHRVNLLMQNAPDRLEHYSQRMTHKELSLLTFRIPKGKAKPA